ncbi:MAG TPA: hypothetical protein VEZ44_07090, partial [bacterium]|nr:hypothetical protein [bacterium]
MTARQSTKSLPWLIGVLVVAALAALYVNVRGGGGGARVSSPPLAQSGAVHTAASASVQTAASQQTAGTAPAGNGSTQGTTTRSTGVSATPAMPTGGTGRAAPFVPLAAARPAGSAPQIGTSTRGSGSS